MEFSAEPPPTGLIDVRAVHQFPHAGRLLIPASSSSPSDTVLFHGQASQEELYSGRGLNRATTGIAREDDSATPSTSPSCSPAPSPLPRRTLLDKPLEQLTEEDIMHLTREDCRRYLKQKGMRRPSWNKSQAIQQVLSLKGLFDSNDDDEKNCRAFTCPDKLNTESSSAIQEDPEQLRGSLDTTQMAESISLTLAGKEISVNYGKVSQRRERKDMCALHQHGDSQLKYPQSKVSTAVGTLSRSASGYTYTDQITATSSQLKECHYSSQRSGSQCFQTSGLAGMEQCGQLTIFYSGMVNVYDNIPQDVARAVMLLAERSNTLRPSLCSHLQNSTIVPAITKGIIASTRPMPHYVHSTVATTELSSTTTCPSASVPVAQSCKTIHSEHQPSRKACLQRYLEKRRGRFSVRSPYAPSVKRADGDFFSNQLMPERYNFSSFLEMVGPLALHASQVQLTTQSSSASEASSSPHLLSCSSP